MIAWNEVYMRIDVSLTPSVATRLTRQRPLVASARLPALGLAGLLHGLEHQLANLGRAIGDDRAGFLECLYFIARCALAAADDGACMAHTSARGCGASGNESDDGFAVGTRVVSLEVFCGILFHRATNLADEDDTFRAGVFKEDLDDVDVLCAGEGVAANTDGEGLAETGEGGLAVCQLQLRCVEVF